MMAPEPARWLASLVALWAIGSSGLAGAQATAAGQARGDAMAAVVLPITMAREADLDFGTVAADRDLAGTVTVPPLGGAAEYGGGAEGICAAACLPPHAARFTVTGEPGRSYAISVPASLSLTPPGGAGVTVARLTVASLSAPGASRGLLSAEGRDSFEVGGTLQLPANATPGHYTTQVPVIVYYL